MVTRKQLRQVPYLDHKHIGDRVVQLMPLHEDGEWRMWHPTPDGRVLELKPVDLGIGDYLATEPARDEDVSFPFLEFVWQRASYPNAARAATAITGDLWHLATSFAKIDFFWEQREAVGRSLDLAEFVLTEVEYVVILSRSVLDHLQEAIASVWNHIKLHDPALQDRKRDLPKRSLADVCMHKGEVRTAVALHEKYGLVEPLAKFYESVGPFVRRVRQLRDGTVHHGSESGPIFVTPKGFGIGKNGRLFKSAPDIWQPEHEFNEAVVSLRPLLAHLAVQALYQCNAAAKALASQIEFPPAMAPDYRVYTRIEHAAALLRAQDVVSGGPVWWAEESEDPD